MMNERMNDERLKDLGETVFLYLEIEGADLEVIDLHDLFAKYSCYASPVGDTYYTYDPDGSKHSHVREKTYFQVRMEYRVEDKAPVDTIICDFLNIFCYDGAPLRKLMETESVKMWVSVAADDSQLSISLRSSTMKRMAELGFDLDLRILQQRRIFSQM